LAALDGEITERRFAARRATDAYLGSARYGQAMLVTAEQLHALDGATGKGEVLSSFAARRLSRLRRKVVRLANAARPDAPASLHALRIAVKRLRYGLEFFAPMTGGRRLKRCSSVLAEAQDALGKLNDLANAGHLLEQCAGTDPRLREAVSLVGGWHVPRHTGLMERVPGILRDLRRLELPRFAGLDG
ncbi:MAG: CHAD domain-containing protein, partial [Rhodocyclaceae bacterium]|nr:CHAD domain-containing protein [Rhodocyclaceae bacterium]